MFFVGDKVRYRSDGEIVEIVEVCGDQYVVDTKDFGKCWEPAEEFKLVERRGGPIREVKKQTIIPGTYGRIVVKHSDDGTNVHIEESDTFNTPEGLRAEATILMMIADAMEDIEV